MYTHTYKSIGIHNVVNSRRARVPATHAVLAGDATGPPAGRIRRQMDRQTESQTLVGRLQVVLNDGTDNDHHVGLISPILIVALHVGKLHGA